MSEKSYIAEAI